MTRLAVFTSHPIQYQAPWFRALAAESGLQVRVFFSHVPDAREQGQGFGRSFSWDLPLRDGYDSTVLGCLRLPDRAPAYVRRPATGLTAALDDFAPDAAMVMGWHEVSLVQAFAACRSRGVPIIMRGESNAKRARPPLAGLAHRAYLRQVASALAIGESNAEFYRAAGVPDGRIVMARYFIDNDRFAQDSERLRGDRDEIRKGWGIEPEAFCLLFAGKLEPKKRVLDALEALRLARTGGAKVRLLVVGDGEQRPAAERFASDHSLPVSFAGFLNQTEMARAYVAADALVLPSDYGETWGLVVNEAMATGLPAIVSERVGCAGDLVLDGQTGAVTCFADPEALADVFTVWAGNPEIARNLGQGGRAHLNSHYTIEGAVAGLRQAVELALAGERRRAP